MNSFVTVCSEMLTLLVFILWLKTLGENVSDWIQVKIKN